MRRRRAFHEPDLYEAGIFRIGRSTIQEFLRAEQHQALKDLVGDAFEAQSRKPRLEIVLKRARKAGARSVIIDGITYTFGQSEQQSTTSSASLQNSRRAMER